MFTVSVYVSVYVYLSIDNSLSILNGLLNEKTHDQKAQTHKTHGRNSYPDNPLIYSEISKQFSVITDLLKKYKTNSKANFDEIGRIESEIESKGGIIYQIVFEKFDKIDKL